MTRTPAHPHAGRRKGLLRELLPPQVEVSERFGDVPEAVLFSQEAELVAGAAAARRQEFATIRWCARTALAGIGVPPAPILGGTEGPAWARRGPRWPRGVVGSMTHCAVPCGRGDP